MNTGVGVGQGVTIGCPVRTADTSRYPSARAPGPIRVLLAEDHCLVRDALAGMLRKEADLQVVGGVGQGGEVLAAVRAGQPDVVLLDITLPGKDGFEIARELATACPGVRVLAVSMHTDRRHVEAMLQAGAMGYVTKHAGPRHLIEAIRAVAGGQHYLCPVAAAALAEAYTPASVAAPRHSLAALTPRERQIVQWLAEGLTTKQIAMRLKRSVRTADACRQQVMEKLGCQSVAQLTRLAIREGLTPLEDAADGQRLGSTGSRSLP